MTSVLPTIPHLAVPIVLNGDGSFAFLYQDTIDEVEQSVEVICGSIPGTRTVVPGFGLPDPTFTNPNPGAIQAAIVKWEPRAIVQVSVQYNEQNEADVSVSVGLQQRGTALRQNVNQ